MADLIEPAPPMDMTQAPIPKDEDDDEDDDLRSGSSAKIDQLVHLLQLSPSDEKSLVFSQFTSFLDKVRNSHTLLGIRYAQYILFYRSPRYLKEKGELIQYFLYKSYR